MRVETPGHITNTPVLSLDPLRCERGDKACVHCKADVAASVTCGLQPIGGLQLAHEANVGCKHVDHKSQAIVLSEHPEGG